MIVALDRTKKIVLLKWLQQGYIDTLDMPDLYNDGSAFLELMKEASMANELEQETSDIHE